MRHCLKGEFVTYNPAVSLVEIIRIIKAAVAYVEADESIRITQMEINLKTALEDNGQGGLVVRVLTLGYTVQDSEVQTIQLKLIPDSNDDHGDTDEKHSVEDQLIVAINTIKIGVKEAQAAEPVFQLQEATVELAFGVTEEGKIEVAKFGRSRKGSVTHTIKLTISRPD